MQTALITGASSGIGESFARRLAARRYDLILVARREDRLRALAAGLPTKADVLVADLAAEPGLEAVERAIRNCATLDLLVNNAGFGATGLFWEADREAQIRMHEVHIMATMRLTRAALEGMVQRRRGGIINVSSVAAFGQAARSVSYCGTKAWINSFTEGIDMELKAVGSPVTIQALCPGFTVTDFQATAAVDTTAIPRFLWMPADYVVEHSLRGLDRGKWLVIPNWKYKLGAFLLKYAPHGLKRRFGRPWNKK
ncbi:MAG TPA: SDR family oxidoreductase [Bryobacteraceae bacterium]